VDTSSAFVAARAHEAGAAIVYDVSAQRDPAMAGVVARQGAGLVLMHMRGTPADMQQSPEYGDVAREVLQVLRERVGTAQHAGVDAECLACDPGIGFGKRPEHNLQLIARLGELRELGRPLVVGASRKSFLGTITGAGVDRRLAAGLAVHALAVWHGASVIRTHDVAETVQATQVTRALARARR
jgi:dihydropteroate synthase